MKVFLFVLINIVVVCSEDSSSTEDEFDLDDWIAYNLCDDHGKEETMADCRPCVKEAAATVKMIRSSKEDDDDEYNKLYSQNYIAKSKIASEKCSQYFENSDQVIECTKLDHDEYFFCLESMFVESANKRKAADYCFEAEKEEECLACIFDSLKKGWEKTHNKIVKREEESFHSEESNEVNDQEENQATEIANNCYQHFKDPNKAKDCGNELFGRRMSCIWDALYAHYEDEDFRIIHSVTLKLCLEHEKEGFYKDCVRCVRETVDSEDHKANKTHDEEQYIINYKTTSKDVIEKCGQFIDEIDEVNECINKDDNDFFPCMDSIFSKQYHREAASDLCDNYSLTDECKDCVYENLKEGWDKMYSKSRKREASEFDEESGIDELEESQAVLIANNCYQHFKIGEKMKVCIDRKLGERMGCIWDLLESTEEESK